MATQQDSPLADDLELALRLAEDASALALELLQRGITASQKSDGSVVTNADVAVERLLTEALTSQRPRDAIFGEELGAVGNSSRRWILDPIDGTRSYVAGRLDWGVHIALEIEGRIVAGVVTRPASGRRWWASRGAGAYAGSLTNQHAVRRLHVSRQTNLDDARVSGWLADNHPMGDRLRSCPAWVEPRDLDDIMGVVEGSIDAFVDGTNTEIWDRAPHAILVEEAGGRYRDHLGGNNLLLPGGRYSNGQIDHALDELLRG
jgi:histidinol-phosphatase